MDADLGVEPDLAIARDNHIPAPYVIRPGERLTLPEGSYVTAPTGPFPVPVSVGA